MRNRTAAILTLFLAAACGKEKGKEAAHEEHAHAHPAAPHGGEILELGEGEYHLELIHDHEGGNVTLHVLGKDVKTPVAVEAPVINLVTKEGPVQFALVPADGSTEGKSSAWKGSHEGLKADPWDGRIRLKIGDKTWQSPLEGEPHDH